MDDTKVYTLEVEVIAANVASKSIVDIWAKDLDEAKRIIDESFGAENVLNCRCLNESE